MLPDIILPWFENTDDAKKSQRIAWNNGEMAQIIFILKGKLCKFLQYICFYLSYSSAFANIIYISKYIVCLDWAWQKK